MPLARRVVPKPLESLNGFLMRAAGENHLATLGLLRGFRERVTHPPTLDDVERLAYFTHCPISEIVKLFGFEYRDDYGRRLVKLGDEYITKEPFVSLRSVSVCANCLREQEPWVPGTWELSLYRACPLHRRKLLDCCPGCRRRLRWTRTTVFRCGCGFDLRSLPGEQATPAQLLFSALVEHRLQPRSPIPDAIEGAPRQLLDQLASLSLDGLFKTIWFLGRRVGSFQSCSTGYGRKKPKDDATIEAAFFIFSNWPDALGTFLDEIAAKSLEQSQANLYRRAFQSLTAYVDERLSSRELMFVRLAYEYEIRKLWRKLNRDHLPKPLNQLEINFA